MKSVATDSSTNDSKRGVSEIIQNVLAESEQVMGTGSDDDHALVVHDRHRMIVAVGDPKHVRARLDLRDVVALEATEGRRKHIGLNAGREVRARRKRRDAVWHADLRERER